jgi:ergothioneine biosynthesis protein EgtB
VDEALDALFARGIDPADEDAAASSGRSAWPSRDEVRAYTHEADGRLIDALREGPGRDAREWSDCVHMVLEHEAMHQETLLYIWHRMPLDQKRRPPSAGTSGEATGTNVPGGRVQVPAGTASLGADHDRVRFGWDNEFPAQIFEVPAFDIDVRNVSNADYLAFIEDGGYSRRDLWTPEGWGWIAASGVTHPLFWEPRGHNWTWRGMFDTVPLPLDSPVYVSQAEASAYARWKGDRLMTEAEFHRAAYGSPDGAPRTYPWGEAAPSSAHGAFDFNTWDPVPIGSRPAGQSAWGVYDLVGNGWEWTSTPFEPFAGFQPHPLYPEYSADFFDGQHYVMKGASPATARELMRPSFRNWFRAQYPYVYATFRCVGTG